MKQTVLFLSPEGTEPMRQYLKEHTFTFSSVLIDEKSLTAQDTLYIENLNKDSDTQLKAKLGRIKKNFISALSQNISLIVVSTEALNEEYAKTYWDDATHSFGTVNLVLDGSSFFQKKANIGSLAPSTKNIFFINSKRVDEFISFCDIMIIDRSEAAILEEKTPLEFLSKLTDGKIIQLMLFDENYNPEEVKNHEYFARQVGNFIRVQIKSSLEDLYGLVKKNSTPVKAGESVATNAPLKVVTSEKVPLTIERLIEQTGLTKKILQGKRNFYKKVLIYARGNRFITEDQFKKLSIEHNIEE